MQHKHALNSKPLNKKAAFWTICQCQETPLATKGYQKGKKRGLNKKVSSAVFRAWTDKQKKFYVCAKCNLTLQTSSVHWNILPPCSAQRKVPGINTTTTMIAQDRLLLCDLRTDA